MGGIDPDRAPRSPPRSSPSDNGGAALGVDVKVQIWFPELRGRRTLRSPFAVTSIFRRPVSVACQAIVPARDGEPWREGCRARRRSDGSDRTGAILLLDGVGMRCGARPASLLRLAGHDCRRKQQSPLARFSPAHGSRHGRPGKNRLHRLAQVEARAMPEATSGSSSSACKARVECRHRMAGIVQHLECRVVADDFRELRHANELPPCQRVEPEHLRGSTPPAAAAEVAMRRVLARADSNACCFARSSRRISGQQNRRANTDRHGEVALWRTSTPAAQPS